MTTADPTRLGSHRSSDSRKTVGKLSALSQTADDFCINREVCMRQSPGYCLDRLVSLELMLERWPDKQTTARSSIVRERGMLLLTLSQGEIRHELKKLPPELQSLVAKLRKTHEALWTLTETLASGQTLNGGLAKQVKAYFEHKRQRVQLRRAINKICLGSETAPGMTTELRTYLDEKPA